MCSIDRVLMKRQKIKRDREWYVQQNCHNEVKTLINHIIKLIFYLIYYKIKVRYRLRLYNSYKFVKYNTSLIICVQHVLRT